MKKATSILKILVILPLVLTFFTCNPIENETKSASRLVVESLLGTNLEGGEANYLQSDVLYEDPDDPSSSTIYSDSASVTFRAELLNPDSLTGPSYLNNITVTRYVVSFTRSDGKNAEGVDVPYTFEGSLSAQIAINSTVTASFIVVREVAKNEPPLVDLVFGTEEGVLQTTARVDFYGHDQTNRNVQATGYLTIFFANYANE
jgi:hypothetical protein